MGQTQESITAWRRVIQMLEESNFRQSFIQNLQVVQTRGWGLLVLDPRTMYDREYGPILKRVRGKLASVEAGGQPAIAPMFEADLHK